VDMGRLTHARLGVLIAGVALLATACFSAEQNEIAILVNASRVEHGRPAVEVNLELSDKAQEWAEHLAEHGELEHSDLPEGLTLAWTALGENVGFGVDIARVHDAYMQSTAHRGNILDPRWTHLGTGFAQTSETVYAVHLFMEY